jgi:hypothetical protein
MHDVDMVLGAVRPAEVVQHFLEFEQRFPLEVAPPPLICLDLGRFDGGTFVLSRPALSRGLSTIAKGLSQEGEQVTENERHKRQPDILRNREHIRSLGPLVACAGVARPSRSPP